MKRILTVALLCGLLSSYTYAQQDSSSLAQSFEFSQLARHTAARVIWELDVDRIDAPEARVVVTALEIVNGPARMRGVRLSFDQSRHRTAVYVAESDLPLLMKELDGIGAGAPAFLARWMTNGSRCFGSGLLRSQADTVFSASQCVFADWTGLSVATSDGTFRFENRTADQLSRSLDLAKTELGSR